MSASTYVFLYGTLRRGGLRDIRCLVDHQSVRFIGECSVNGTMHSIDDQFPAVTLGEIGTIKGELVEVQPAVLDVLDYIEGHNDQPEDSLYFRVKIKVTGPSGRIYDAWIYEGTAKIIDSSTKTIESGDWLAYHSTVGSS